MDERSETKNSPTAQPASIWNRFRFEISLMGMFVLITILYYWPLLINLNGHFADFPIGDKGTNLWNLWWVYYAIFELHTSPLWCDLLYYPWGIDLRYHTLSLTNGLLAAPITAIWGPKLAYNVLFLMWTILTGFFAGLWAKRFGVSFWGALLVGLVAAFGPYRTSHEIHLNLFSTHWLFLCFWWLEICLERNRLWHWLLFSLFWLLATFSSFYYALFIGVYWAVRLLVWAWFRFPFRSWRESPWKAEIPLFIVFLSLVFFFYVPQTPREVQPDDVPFQLSLFWSLDIVQLILSNNLIDILEETLNVSLLKPGNDGPEFNLHPGMTISILVLVAIFAGRKIRWNHEYLVFLLIAMSTFWVLSLGPVLKYCGEPFNVMNYPFLLPAFAFEMIPMLSSIRVYARFAYIGFVVFTLFGAFGMDYFLYKIRNMYLKLGCLFFVFFGPVIFMIFIIAVSPTIYKFYKMKEFTIPKHIQSNVEGPVFEIPIEPTKLSGLHLYHQTFHHQPIYVAEFSRLQNYRKRYLNELRPLETIEEILDIHHQEQTQLTQEEQVLVCQLANELGIENIWHTHYPIETSPSGFQWAKEPYSFNLQLCENHINNIE